VQAAEKANLKYHAVFEGVHIGACEAGGDRHTRGMLRKEMTVVPVGRCGSSTDDAHIE
jgi:hypothetical protein